MGLMDNIGDVAGNLMKGQNSDIVKTVINMISNKEKGGLSGIINSFNDKGLGGIISSWISKDENKPISDDDLKKGFGEDRINEIAEKTGKPKETVISDLKGTLPQLVDKLTPDGDVPDDNMLQKGLDQLKNLKF